MYNGEIKHTVTTKEDNETKKMKVIELPSYGIKMRRTRRKEVVSLKPTREEWA